MLTLCLCPIVNSFACYTSSDSFENESLRNFRLADYDSDPETGLLVVDCFTAEEHHARMKVEHEIARLERLAERKAANEVRYPQKVERQRSSYRLHLDQWND
jgi:hypothetical protein